MKDKQIAVQLEQLAALLESEINSEQDTNRNCRLQDAKEYLRRAYHKIDDSPCTNNDLLCFDESSDQKFRAMADVLTQIAYIDDKRFPATSLTRDAIKRLARQALGLP